MASSVPTHELDDVIQSIVEQSALLDPAFVKGEFRRHGLTVIGEPDSHELARIIVNATRERRPLSVVRFGDGEMNLLTYGAYPDTPCLNEFVVRKFISMQADRFELDPAWMVVLRDQMMAALTQADVIGALGVWRLSPMAGKEPRTREVVAERLQHDLRGHSGHWRGIEYMLKLAGQGVMNRKTVASAHLYFSVLEHLGELIDSASQVCIISNRKQAYEDLVSQNPGKAFLFIEIGKTVDGDRASSPGFLADVFARLPDDMSGCLALVGAGPWSEIYCTWIKQRGGVAVDVGSGFDLWTGQLTRPIHRRVGQETLSKYFL